MPKVSPKRHAAPQPSFRDEDVSITSVVFGLVMVAALIVAAAALMGGSLSRVESRMANTTDGLARIVGLAVSEVTIVGLEHDHVLAGDVRAAAMIEPGENMFRADPHAIRGRVEATRKVVNVRVHRLWPDQIVIMADAAQPMALHYSEGDWQVLDTLGRTMDDTSPQDHLQLVKLMGVGAETAGFALVSALEGAPETAARIQYAERVANRRWDLRMTNGQLVRLPRDASLPVAIARLQALQDSFNIAARPLQTLDLRTPGRVYMTPTDGADEGGNA